MPQAADHFHWDTNENWLDVRKGLSESSSRAGGGHAHTGMTIYLGDNWPAEFRNNVLTWNFHGRRMNRDVLSQHGATYVARHRKDLFQSGDIWFRGIELGYGPDGGLFALDWSDLGECHENDGVHRTSGRIFKIRWGNAQARPLGRDLARDTDAALVNLQLEPNDWYVRQARRLLQERAASGHDMKEAAALLLQIYQAAPDVRHRLRALWCLNAIGHLNQQQLLQQLNFDNEHMRAWAVRLLADQPLNEEAIAALEQRARTEHAGLVLSYMASALQRMPLNERWRLASHLVRRAEFAEDRALPYMIWYGVEPAVASEPKRAAQLALDSKMPRVTRWIARRLAYELGNAPDGVDRLVQALRDADDGFRLSVLTGMERGLRGWLSATQPPSWTETAKKINAEGNPQLTSITARLSAVFGDGRAATELLSLISDDSEDTETRRQAIQALVGVRATGLAQVLTEALRDRDLGPTAVKGLAAVGDARTPQTLIDNYQGMSRPARQATIEALASRPAYARQLLSALEAEKVEARLVPPFLMRQMQLFGDAEITNRIGKLWPERRLIGVDKLKQIRHYQSELTEDRLADATASNGRQLFDKTCAKCHKLFGEGGDIGPELTGAQRSNLNYLLENIVDPSATLARSYRMSIVLLTDDRILNGVVSQQTDRTITLQTPTEKLVLDRTLIEEIRPSELSLMPDGLLADMSIDQVADLVRYLQSQ